MTSWLLFWLLVCWFFCFSNKIRSSVDKPRLASRCLLGRAFWRPFLVGFQGKASRCSDQLPYSHGMDQRTWSPWSPWIYSFRGTFDHNVAITLNFIFWRSRFRSRLNFCFFDGPWVGGFAFSDAWAFFHSEYMKSSSLLTIASIVSPDAFGWPSSVNSSFTKANAFLNSQKQRLAWSCHSSWRSSLRGRQCWYHCPPRSENLLLDKRILWVSLLYRVPHNQRRIYRTHISMYWIL